MIDWNYILNGLDDLASSTISHQYLLPFRNIDIELKFKILMWLFMYNQIFYLEAFVKLKTIILFHLSPFDTIDHSSKPKPFFTWLLGFHILLIFLHPHWLLLHRLCWFLLIYLTSKCWSASGFSPQTSLFFSSLFFLSL